VAAPFELLFQAARDLRVALLPARAHGV